MRGLDQDEARIRRQLERNPRQGLDVAKHSGLLDGQWRHCGFGSWRVDANDFRIRCRLEHGGRRRRELQRTIGVNGSRDDGRCLNIGHRFDVRPRHRLVFGRGSLRSHGALAPVAALLAVRIALATVTPATSTVAPASAALTVVTRGARARLTLGYGC